MGYMPKILLFTIISPLETGQRYISYHFISPFKMHQNATTWRVFEKKWDRTAYLATQKSKKDPQQLHNSLNTRGSLRIPSKAVAWTVLNRPPDIVEPNNGRSQIPCPAARKRNNRQPFFFGLGAAVLGTHSAWKWMSFLRIWCICCYIFMLQDHSLFSHLSGHFDAWFPPSF